MLLLLLGWMVFWHARMLHLLGFSVLLTTLYLVTSKVAKWTSRKSCKHRMWTNQASLTCQSCLTVIACQVARAPHAQKKTIPSDVFGAFCDVSPYRLRPAGMAYAAACGSQAGADRDFNRTAVHCCHRMLNALTSRCAVRASLFVNFTQDALFGRS